MKKILFRLFLVIAATIILQPFLKVSANIFHDSNSGSFINQRVWISSMVVDCANRAIPNMIVGITILRLQDGAMVDSVGVTTNENGNFSNTFMLDPLEYYVIIFTDENGNILRENHIGPLYDENGALIYGLSRSYSFTEMVYCRPA